MTQAYGGLKSLKPNKKPINTLLGVRVSKSFHSLHQSRERTLVSTILVPRHKEESLGRRSWCLWDPLWLWCYLHRLELIREHPNQRYMTLFSRSMFSMVSILFLNISFIYYNTFRETMIDFACTLHDLGHGNGVIQSS